MPAAPGPALLELDGLSKSFGPTLALDAVDLRIEPGTVHALIGQNGSGKSTLIKILSGYHAPDAGTVAVRGQTLRLPLKPGEAHAHGLSFLHQDLGLAPGMTVLENLRLGRFETTAYGRLRWRRERAAAARVLREMGLAVDPHRPLRELPPAERALVAFLRAYQDVEARGGLLVLDEPTAYLPSDAVGKLFAAIREVVALGSSVLFVSHRLDEVLDIADRISVLRNGRRVGTLAASEATRERVVELLLGRALGELYPPAGEAVGKGRPPLLSVRGLAGGSVRGLGLDLRPGEILGATGLLGMGHDDIPYLLFGAKARASGTVAVEGSEIASLEPTTARAAGLALLPADRGRQSGTPTATILENVTLPDLGRYFRGGRLRHREEGASVRRLLERFDVRPPLPDRPLATLSGGNQQKALLAKWLHGDPRVLLLHEPTQGVDIGSRKQLFAIIRDVADRGMAVFIASAEYEDLAHLCDRVLVLRHGSVVAELAGDDLTEDAIVQHCYLATGGARRTVRYAPPTA